MKQVVAKVPEELHRAVKAEAARRGLTISEVVKQLLEGWLEQEDDERQMVLGKISDRSKAV
jgi:predicted HicB family RNase H-like nuclease